MEERVSYPGDRVALRMARKVSVQVSSIPQIAGFPAKPLQFTIGTAMTFPLSLSGFSECMIRCTIRIPLISLPWTAAVRQSVGPGLTPLTTMTGVASVLPEYGAQESLSIEPGLTFCPNNWNGFLGLSVLMLLPSARKAASSDLIVTLLGWELQSSGKERRATT